MGRFRTPCSVDQKSLRGTFFTCFCKTHDRCPGIFLKSRRPSITDHLYFYKTPSLHVLPSTVLLITSISISGPLTNSSAKEIEDKRYGTARKADESEQRTSLKVVSQSHHISIHLGTGTYPLIAQPMIHLGSEEHDSRAPERANERFGSQCGRREMLVGIHKIVVGAVVQKDESETDGETTHHWSGPMDIRC